MSAILQNLRRRVGRFGIYSTNRLLGRTFVPHPLRELFIEPTNRCNLACRFCAHGKAVRTPATMDMAFFQQCIDQAAEMGFQHICLTPQTGDIFTDEHIFHRFSIIDASSIPKYSFVTNFIGINPSKIQELSRLKKLYAMNISLYGKDEEEFCRITRRSQSLYSRLIRNLSFLAEHFHSWDSPKQLLLSMRTTRQFCLERWESPLAEIVHRLMNLNNVCFGFINSYDSWGGLITNSDVGDLDVEIIDGTNFYKFGTCIHAIGWVQVLADGTVNACPCRDPLGILKIGHLKEMPLEWILSTKNQAYLNIIAEMNQGIFRTPCQKCSFYTSIYDHRWAKGQGKDLVVDLSEFIKIADCWGNI